MFTKRHGILLIVILIAQQGFAMDGKSSSVTAYASSAATSSSLALHPYPFRSVHASSSLSSSTAPSSSSSPDATSIAVPEYKFAGPFIPIGFKPELARVRSTDDVLAGPRVKGYPITILYVEDEKTARKLNKRILENAAPVGSKVLIAKNPRKAIELVSSQRFDAVIFDNQIGGASPSTSPVPAPNEMSTLLQEGGPAVVADLSGLELFRRINQVHMDSEHSSFGGNRMPLVTASNTSDGSTVEESYRKEGAVFHFSKVLTAAKAKKFCQIVIERKNAGIQAQYKPLVSTSSSLSSATVSAVSPATLCEAEPALPVSPPAISRTTSGRIISTLSALRTLDSHASAPGPSSSTSATIAEDEEEE